MLYLGIHVVSPEEEKERLQWERFAGKEVGFKPGMKQRVCDGKQVIIISMTVSSINGRTGKTHQAGDAYNVCLSISCICLFVTVFSSPA